MEKMKNLIKKYLNKETLLYLVFGLLTTAVNLGVYFILTRIFNLTDVALANNISIVISVLFAYITNSIFVFNSKLNFREFCKFILGRLFAAVVEIAGFALLINVLCIHDFISKIIITAIVIVLNYFTSKYFAFKKK